MPHAARADCDEIESVIAGFGHLREIRGGGAANCIEFVFGDGPFGFIVGSPADFDEDQFFGIEGDDVDFPTSNCEVSCDNGIAFGAQVVRRHCLVFASFWNPIPTHETILNDVCLPSRATN